MTREPAPPTAVLVTHVNPPIHGQSLIATTLVESSVRWAHVRLVVVNTVYARDRESLIRFSVRKSVLLLRYIWSAVVTIRRRRATVAIVTPSFYPGPFVKDALMIYALRVFTRARIVAWVHMDPARLDLERKPVWYVKLALHSTRRVDRWVACAPTLLKQWPSFIPVDRRGAIANGASGPGHVREPELGRGRARVCYVSSMEASKGWIELLEAAEQICASNPDVDFHFYGGVGVGSTVDAVRERFRACTHPERIVWHGHVPDDEKWSALLSSHLFCFPSHTEQFPVAILEAMACGLAIVATRVGAIEDAVVEGEGGWLVDPGSSDELVGAIREALDDRERLVRFGTFNQLRQKQRFSIDAFGAEWERFLSRVVAED